MDLDGLPLPPLEALLSEAGGFVFEVDAGSQPRCLASFAKLGVTPQRIGRVLEDRRIVMRSGTRAIFDLDVAPLWEAWSRRLGPWMEGIRDE